MAHFIKIGVRIKTINRQVQTFDCVCFAPAFERLLYRNQLISQSKSRNRMPFVNLKNDFPGFGIKHDVSEARALRILTYRVAPSFKESPLPPASLGSGDTLCRPTLWAMFGPLPVKLFHITEHREISNARGLYLPSSGDRKVQRMKA